MQIDIVTLFPEMFKGPLSESMIKIAQKKGVVTINVHDLRDWTNDRHKTADDKPYGGGSGMVMKIEPVYKAINDLRTKDTTVVLFTPQGRTFSQSVAKKYAKKKKILLVCGHYEGVDDRIRLLVDDEISIGDYVLTCGELPACVFVDSVSRLIPGVLGNKDCLTAESFENELLEYPQYTRPREFEGMKVPEIILSGDHLKIKEWRKKEAIKRTKDRRPDLYKKFRKGDKK